MYRLWLVVLFAFTLLLSACSSAGPAAEDTPPAPTFQVALVRANPLPVDKSDYFAGSGMCASCHQNMVDESGQDVSSDRLWRATMMANSARDPYWQAAVRAEGIANPALREVIEDKCTTCHTPMARFTEVHNSPREIHATFLDGGYSNPEHPLHVLGMDGVSCTLCHQIENLNLGEDSSFSGGYAINPDLPKGNRINYGPYEVAPEDAERMRVASGFIPVYGEHMSEAEVCATCHGLFTPTLDAQGNIVGEFPEQMVYHEWQHSSYRNTIACQGCHMPLAQGGVRLSITGGELRRPFYQHVFVGGNAYVPRLFQAFGSEMEVTASGEQFETTIQNAEAMIGTRSAQVSILNTQIQGGMLEAEIEIRSMVGHKFPSGFPSRRTWLHVTVLDAGGAVVFESGGYEANGAIRGNANDEDPNRYEPHYTLIQSPDQVQIYEAIMHNTDGELTTILLRGAGYSKDNRLLPAGFDKATAPPVIAVAGEAVQDDTFAAGGDTIRYQVPLGSAQGPFTLQVELLYQTIGFRWADNLRAYDSVETSRFIRYYESIPNLPLTAARAEATGIR
jgi:hypothetical protein